MLKGRGVLNEGSTTVTTHCRCCSGCSRCPDSSGLDCQPRPTQDRRFHSVQRRLYFPKIELRLGVAALLAVCLQAAAIFAPLGDDDLPRRVLFVASYLLLIAFVVANVRRPGIAILGAGLLLNFAVIAANGGLMPVTPETLLKTGSIPDDAEMGEWVPETKDVLKDRDDVHLYFLSDRLVIDELGPIRAFSIGDVVIVIGLVLTVADLLLPRLQRDSRAVRGAP